MAETQSAHRIAYSRAPFSAWFAVVCLFVLFGLIVLAVIGPSPRTSDYEEARAKKRMERLKTLHEESQKELTTYAWIDKGKGVARIPINRAMQVTVADLAQKKPAPAGPIVVPATQVAPAGASPAPAVPQGAAVSSVTPAKAASPSASSTSQPAQSSAPAGSPSGQGAASPSPASQSSPPALASPAPATTP